MRAKAVKLVRNTLKSVTIGIACLYLLIAKLLPRICTRRIIRSTAAFFGHLALEPENYLSARSAGVVSGWVPGNTRTQSKDWWTLGKIKSSPNPTLARAWRKKISVPPSWWIDAVIRAGNIIPSWAFAQVNASLFGVGNAIDDTDIHFELSDLQVQEAQRQLTSLGVNLQLPYVALVVRDERYFEQVGNGLSDGRMRNRDITDFVPAVEALVGLGIQVIRLGHLVAAPIGVSHPLVFDYAVSGKRSELLDIYIPLNAMATISTLTGSDALAIVGRRPVLYVDVALYAQVFHSTSGSVWIPARLRKVSTQKLLSLSEVFTCGAGWFVGPSEFASHEIEVVRSTTGEIAEYVVDFISQVRRDGTYTGSHSVQMHFREELARAMSEEGIAMHGDVRSNIMDGFVSRHPDFLSSLHRNVELKKEGGSLPSAEYKGQ